MISLEGGCTGCSSTPMTAMQIYYSLMKLEEVKDVIFLNGELPEYMRAFIDDKLKIGICGEHGGDHQRHPVPAVEAGGGAVGVPTGHAAAFDLGLPYAPAAARRAEAFARRRTALAGGRGWQRNGHVRA